MAALNYVRGAFDGSERPIKCLAFFLVTTLAACGGRSASTGSRGSRDSGTREATDASVPGSDVADMDASAPTCSSPHDCPNHFGPQLYCCVNHACTMDEPDACADGGEQPIVASNYDQSCTTDMDCILIAEGNACSIVGPCPTAAINKGAAYSKYQSDIANTPCFGVSSCGSYSGPCCRHGICQMNFACSSPLLAICRRVRQPGCRPTGCVRLPRRDVLLAVRGSAKLVRPFRVTAKAR
jgi:hypothetical protein